jgi:hypothetical protein
VPKAAGGRRLERWLIGQTVIGWNLYRARVRFLGAPDEKVSSSAEQQDAVMEAVLEKFSGECEERGMAFGVITVPASEDHSRRIETILQRLNVPRLSLQESFELFRDEQTTHLRDPHWNALGHRIAGEAVAEWLRSLLKGSPRNLPDD